MLMHVAMWALVVIGYLVIAIPTISSVVRRISGDRAL